MSVHIPPGGGGPERWRTFRAAIASWRLTLRLCLLLLVCQFPVIIYLVLHK